MTLGFPACSVAVFVWATAEARRVLGDPPSNHHLLAQSSLEDLVESISKLRRAYTAGDAVTVRWRAHTAARETPGLLRDLNPPQLVHNSTEALKAALALPVAPPHYAADFPRAFGLSSADDDAVAAAALRLARELLAFLRERNPEADPQPGVADALRDGAFEHHLGFVDN